MTDPVFVCSLIPADFRGIVAIESEKPLSQESHEGIQRAWKHAWTPYEHCPPLVIFLRPLRLGTVKPPDYRVIPTIENPQSKIQNDPLDPLP